MSTHRLYMKFLRFSRPLKEHNVDFFLFVHVVEKKENKNGPTWTS